MMRHRWLVLVVCLGAWSLAAQTTPIDAEIGYRWTDISGNQGLYRTQINERGGLLLRALTLASVGRERFMDHLRLDVDEMGAGPASSLRLEAGLTGAYRVNLRFRRTDAFSALPSFANPLLAGGVVPGQHTFDRTRNVLDADVEILRWSAIKPFIGYTSNHFEGPGTTTWHVGQDEFLLSQQLRDTDRELRLGAGFEFGPVAGQFTQGWRRFHGHETLTLAPGANNGNNTDPVLERPINASALTREERTDVDTPFTTFSVTGQATPRIRLIGSFVRFAADSDSTGSDDATGSLASFALGRFFNGLDEQSSSRAKNTTWRGSARAEIALNEQFDLTAGYRREHRELDGSALIRTLYLQSITFGGADPRDVETILRATNALEREEDVIDAGVSFRPLKPIVLRAGVSQSKMGVTVSPDLSEIVIDGGQGGTFDRRVRTFHLDGSYAVSSFTVGASLQSDSANGPILRTDFLDRDRYRLRGAWKAPRFVSLAVVAEETKQSNDRPDVAYDSTMRQYTADVVVTPLEPLSLRASASRFHSHSNILFRRPENFTIGESVHLERGRSVEGGLTFSLSRVTFDGDLSHFENNGSIPFELDRSRARVTVQLRDSVAVGAEWSRDEYTEAALAVANFEASRYGLFVRLRR
ncbi:MAG: hypothetical protein QOD51_2179 [Candidatus Eremiobacteraeota bacterium]|nr:hypothetical protein [Candidatus Eremiobacteraeota bacterium]